MLGVIALSTVLSLWIGRPESVPAVFTRAASIAVAALSLVALIVAAPSRRAGKRYRRVVAAFTIPLAIILQVLAFGQFASREVVPDTALAAVLTSGVAAMIALAVRTLRVKPA